MITGILNIILEARVRNIISKGPRYIFASNIDFTKCLREIAADGGSGLRLNDGPDVKLKSVRWCLMLLLGWAHCGPT